MICEEAKKVSRNLLPPVISKSPSREAAIETKEYQRLPASAVAASRLRRLALPGLRAYARSYVLPPLRGYEWRFQP